MGKKLKAPKRPRMDRPCPSGCDACCVVLEVKATRSAAREPCRYLEDCDGGRKCSIYVRRPTPCREFGCAYTVDSSFPEWAAPSAIGILARFEVGRFGIGVTLDEVEEGAGDRDEAQSLIGELVARGLLVILRRVDRTRGIYGPEHRLDEVEAALRASHPKAFSTGAITLTRG